MFGIGNVRIGCYFLYFMHLLECLLQLDGRYCRYNKGVVISESQMCELV